MAETTPHPETTRLRELAKRVIEVLDKQRDYFRTRSTKVLTESKELERALRLDCRDILAEPRPRQGDLLEGGGR